MEKKLNQARSNATLVNSNDDGNDDDADGVGDGAHRRLPRWPPSPAASFLVACLFLSPVFTGFYERGK